MEDFRLELRLAVGEARSCLEGGVQFPVALRNGKGRGGGGHLLSTKGNENGIINAVRQKG